MPSYMDVEIVEGRTMYRVSEWLSLVLHVGAGLSSFVLATLLNVPIVFWSLLGLMAIDVITGLTAAYITGEISSDASWKGMARKTIVLLLVLAAEVAANAIPEGGYFTLRIPAGSIVAGMFCVHELISITENAVRAGVSPPYMLRVLKKGLKEFEKEREEEADRKGRRG